MAVLSDCNYPAAFASPQNGDLGVRKVDAAGLGNTIFSAIRNLGTFYFAKAAPYDWTSPQNGNLWRDDVKTLFDPCPTGWRVPRSGAGNLSPWNTFGTDPYAAPFFYYINGVKQTAAGTPAFEAHPNNGRLYDRENGDPTAWYPAPGIRDAGSNSKFGESLGVGHYGYDWSSSVSGGGALYFRFDSSGVHPSNANARSSGFSVRCVRE